MKQVTTSEKRRRTGISPGIHPSYLTSTRMIYEQQPPLAYSDDLAIMDSAPKWQTLEGTLSQDMATFSTYLQK